MTKDESRVYLGLGSNVGDRCRQLRRGLDRLQAAGLSMRRISSLYLTEPVGGRDDPWYVNCVAALAHSWQVPSGTERSSAESGRSSKESGQSSEESGRSTAEGASPLERPGRSSAEGESSLEEPGRSSGNRGSPLEGSEGSPVAPGRPTPNSVRALGGSGRSEPGSSQRNPESTAPEDLLRICLRVERECGRRRGSGLEPGARRSQGSPDPNPEPRELDVDILLYGDLVRRGPELTVPHPSMHRRRFVLRPLVEIAPGAWHPVEGATASALLRRLAEEDGDREGSGVWVLAPPPTGSPKADG